VKEVEFAMVEVKKKVCLIVIDGWGISENKEGNKILFLKKQRCLSLAFTVVVNLYQ